ncbi:hypothetical protein COV89_03390 [Candidatus Shapirobacteria bacterium CG11_big_fil_rev_8_21_14_0_20_40_12]|uniref:Uncharacterized protein n=2 Tax=Candidatus Shapironibacteriota TaxID=1752721 RepID=A0A2H0KHM3_9BACT|nr:MAG: hypothetical protein COV89_03390 [Candidatus Shapirobacteria bacterium CG11_big_fil_rev_8_21_14_0_20_40_12]
MKDCCETDNSNKHTGVNKGIFQGLFYGILPHSFCIAFIIFTVIGSTVAVGFFRKFLLTPFFFEMLIGLSFVFATLSAIIYLRRKKGLSIGGIRENLGYLGILYGTTLIVNLLLFLVIFPAVANSKVDRNLMVLGSGENSKTLNLQVKIPCSGHAPLIIEELGKEKGVIKSKFVFPDIFEVSYDPQKTDLEKILQAEIFKSFPVSLKE